MGFYLENMQWDKTEKDFVNRALLSDLVPSDTGTRVRYLSMQFCVHSFLDYLCRVFTGLLFHYWDFIVSTHFTQLPPVDWNHIVLYPQDHAWIPVAFQTAAYWQYRKWIGFNATRKLKRSIPGEKNIGIWTKQIWHLFLST